MIICEKPVLSFKLLEMVLSALVYKRFHTALCHVSAEKATTFNNINQNQTQLTVCLLTATKNKNKYMNK